MRVLVHPRRRHGHEDVRAIRARGQHDVFGALEESAAVDHRSRRPNGRKWAAPAMHLLAVGRRVKDVLILLVVVGVVNLHSQVALPVHRRWRRRRRWRSRWRRRRGRRGSRRRRRVAARRRGRQRRRRQRRRCRRRGRRRRRWVRHVGRRQQRRRRIRRRRRGGRRRQRRRRRRVATGRRGRQRWRWQQGWGWWGLRRWWRQRHRRVRVGEGARGVAAVTTTRGRRAVLARRRQGRRRWRRGWRLAGALAVDHVLNVHAAALVRVLVHRRRCRRHEVVRAIRAER